MPQEDVIHGQGSTFTWGTVSFIITSVQLSNSSDQGGEIDITSMSSQLVQDDQNTNRKLVVRDYDSCFSNKGGAGLEMAIDFYADSNVSVGYFEAIGSKRGLYFAIPSDSYGSPGFVVNSTAILSQMQLGVATGEYVKGSATFKLSGQ